MAFTLQEFIHVKFKLIMHCLVFCVLFISSFSSTLLVNLSSLIILRSPPPSNVKRLPSRLWRSKEYTPIFYLSRRHSSAAALMHWSEVLWNSNRWRSVTFMCPLSSLSSWFSHFLEKVSQPYSHLDVLQPSAPFWTEKTETCQYVKYIRASSCDELPSSMLSDSTFILARVCCRTGDAECRTKASPIM